MEVQGNLLTASLRDHAAATPSPSMMRGLERWIESFVACPWTAHIGSSPWETRVGAHPSALRSVKLTQASTHRNARGAPLYTTEERARRDASPWTYVQAVLAPLQFAICLASLLLIARYFATGEGYQLAVGSVLLKTAALYAIMVTGSIWERQVFGRWLFAPAFFWEDVVSMLVLTLQTTYVVALLEGWGSPAEQLAVAVAAYAAYAVNASQFLLKLRAARLDAPRRASALAA